MQLTKLIFPKTYLFRFFERAPICFVDYCPQTQTAALLQELRRLLEIALRHAGRQGSELTADLLLECLCKGPKERFPQQ